MFRFMNESATTTSDRKAGPGPRVGAVLAALVMAFGTAVAVLVMLMLGDTATCADVFSGDASFNDDGECFDGSSGAKIASLVLGWPGAILGGISVLLALAFTITGRGGRRFVGVAVAAAVLFGLSILVGSI